MKTLIDIAQHVLNKLTTKGCQKAQCETIKTEMNEFNVDGNEFSLFRTTYDEKINITSFKDNKKGNISINKFDEQSIDDAIKNCLEVTESSQEDFAYDIAPHIGKKYFEKGAIIVDLDKFFERCNELVKNINDRHPKIVMEQLVFRHNRTDKIYIDTNDNEYSVAQGTYCIGMMYSGHEGEKSTSFFWTELEIDRLDKPFIELGNIEKDLTNIEKQLSTVDLTGKIDGTVIMAPSCIPAILYSVVENFAGDSAILSGTSIWKNKINTKVADERLTISFSPMDKRIVEGDCYTQEGFLSENFDFIKDGILKSFYITQYVANKTNLERAKNNSFNLIVNNGDKSIDDIIKNCKHGIIVGRFSGGAPSTNGDFSGVAKNSFLVENGKIVGGVNEVMISGNLSDLLNNIVDISKEVVEDGLMVLPYIAVKNVVIAGK